MNQVILKEYLDYSPESGVFRWKKNVSSQKRAGDIAGSKHTQGYIHIMIEGKRYLAHRLAWMYQTGDWPKQSVDHINGVKSDNRWANLRDVSHAENLQNRVGPQKDNKIGVLGVVMRRGKITAQIKVNGESKRLGTFATVEQAHQAYREAKAKYHPTAPIGGAA